MKKTILNDAESTGIGLQEMQRNAVLNSEGGLARCSPRAIKCTPREI